MYIQNKNNIYAAGLYPIIVNASNIQMNKNYIYYNNSDSIFSYTSKSFILINDSNVNFDNSSGFIISSCNKNIPNNLKIINNSKVNFQYYNTLEYSASVYNNSFLNFPSFNYCNLTAPNFNNYTHGIITNVNGFEIIYISGNIQYSTKNDKQIKWGKQLINDGSCFKFYGKTANDIIYPYKIKYFKISQKDIKNNLQNILKFIPKDLHQATLLIQLDSCNTAYCYELSGFYNGKIEIKSLDKTKASLSYFKFINCQNIYIHDAYLMNKYKDLLAYPFKFKNCQSVIIQNSIINNTILGTNNFISEISNFNYKQGIIKYQQDFYKYELIGSFNTTNAVIKNCEFNKHLTINSKQNYKNHVFFIASKNSSIISNNNKFYVIDNNHNYTKRPIIFYSAYNSKIIAKNDSLYNNPNSLLILSNDTLKDEPIENSIIYGYALPGGIFNHNHSQHILTEKEKNYKNNISGGLPIGSIFWIYKVPSSNYFSSSGTAYTDQIIGYKNITSQQKDMKLFLSTTSACKYDSKYKDIALNEKCDLTTLSQNALFPLSSNSIDQNIISSQYADNLFYFNKYFTLCSSSVSTICIYWDKYKNTNLFDLSNQDIDNQLVVKYSMYTNYNKQDLLINNNSKVKEKFQQE